MHPSTLHATLAASVAALLLVACSGDAPPSQPAPPTSPSAAAQPGASDEPDGGLANVLVEVRRSPGCTCCHAWEGHMRDAGYTVTATDEPDIAALKRSHGLPEEAWSCHTAFVEGYLIEGHVPAEAIADLLAARPDIDGLALPGMPPGSPGMPGQKTAPFEVLALKDGDTSLFGSY